MRGAGESAGELSPSRRQTQSVGHRERDAQRSERCERADARSAATGSPAPRTPWALGSHPTGTHDSAVPARPGGLLRVQPSGPRPWHRLDDDLCRATRGTAAGTAIPADRLLAPVAPRPTSGRAGKWRPTGLDRSARHSRQDVTATATGRRRWRRRSPAPVTGECDPEPCPSTFSSPDGHGPGAPAALRERRLRGSTLRSSPTAQSPSCPACACFSSPAAPRPGPPGSGPRCWVC